jgi:hypothetical protein
MKQRIFSWTLMAAVSTGAFILAGCETLENRITEHPDVFNSLSPSEQALVRNGQIRSGMSVNAVWLAWGSPEQKTHGEMRGRPTETWVYVQTRSAPYGSYGYPYYGYGPGFYGGGGVAVVRHHHHGRAFVFFGDPFYDPFYYSAIPPTISIPYKTATFVNGRLVSWQYLTR